MGEDKDKSGFVIGSLSKTGLGAGMQHRYVYVKGNMSSNTAGSGEIIFAKKAPTLF